MSGILALAAKPQEDLDMWSGLCRETGRRLHVFGPDWRWQFNLLDYLRAKGADARELCESLMLIDEPQQAARSQGGDNDGFFRPQMKRGIQLAIVPLLLAEGTISTPMLQEFINCAALNAVQLTDAKWREGYHNQVWRRAYENIRTEQDKSDMKLASDYWLKEWVGMAEKTRSGIETSLMQLLFPLNSGMCRPFFSEGTNITPDILCDDAVILIDMAPAKYGETGVAANMIWKLATQKMILRRCVQPTDEPVIIWCDEFHQFVNSFDVYFLTQCRSHRGSIIALTQSPHNLHAALGERNAEHQTKSLLSQFGTRIFHAMGDVEGADFGANLVGKERQMFFNSSSQVPNNAFDAMTGQSQQSNGFSEQLDYRIPPDRFINGLRTGGAANGLVDGIVVKSGMPFSSGQNFMIATFQQK